MHSIQSFLIKSLIYFIADTPCTRVRPSPRTIKIRPGKVERERWKCKKLRPATNAEVQRYTAYLGEYVSGKLVPQMFWIVTSTWICQFTQKLLFYFPKQRGETVTIKQWWDGGRGKTRVVRPSDRQFIDRASDWLAWNWAGHRWRAAPWVRMGTINSAFRVEQNHSNCCLVL